MILKVSNITPTCEDESMISVNAAMESNFAAFFEDFLPLWSWLFIIVWFCWFDLLKLDDCAEVLHCCPVDVFAAAAALVSVLSGVASDSWTSSKISWKCKYVYRVINYKNENVFLNYFFQSIVSYVRNCKWFKHTLKSLDLL